MTDKNTMWNSAARSGLVLGCICIAYLMANHFLAKALTGSGAAVAATIGSSILWIAKFSLCIILMRRFIIDFVADTGADQYEARSFGRRTALLSAMIYSGFYLAYVLYINPTVFTDAADTVAASGMLTPEQMELLDSGMDKMPAATFFGNLIYCYLFGALLTLIFTATISTNPFDDFDEDEVLPEDDAQEEETGQQ